MSEREIVRLNIDKDFESFKEISVHAFGPGTNLSKEMHRWLLDENPYNKDGNMMYVLKEGNKIIGADGLFPVELYVGGKVILAAHSIKSMTHPEYQRQGIFRKMTENSLQKAKEFGVDLVFGLANDQSYRAYQNFGWPTVFEKEVYVKPIRVTKMLHRRLKVMALAKLLNSGYQLYSGIKNKLYKNYIDKDIKIQQLEQVPASVQQCWDKYKEKFYALTVRDYKYLDYRYNKRPDVKYKTILATKGEEVVGFVIIRSSVARNTNVASIVEMFTDPDNEKFIGTLAMAAVNYSKNTGIDYMVIGTGLWGRYRDVLYGLGFTNTKKKPKNNMMIAKTLSDKITIEEIDGHEKWHITQGDGETELDL